MSVKPRPFHTDDVQLVLGAGHLERILHDAEDLLIRYRTDDEIRYLEYQPTTPMEWLLPEDLAVTILINSRVGSEAFKSVQDHGASVSLASLPDKPLESTTSEERDRLANVVAEITRWDGFAASVATKVLHKKRPHLIPILDNEAIFGAYMNPRWPSVRASRDSVFKKSRIREAVEWIFTDLTRSENLDTWTQLRRLAPRRSLIEIFDMVWWVHFRAIQPVRPTSPI